MRVVNGIRNYDRAVRALLGGDGAAERLSRFATYFDPVGFERRWTARRLDCPFIFHRDGNPIGVFASRGIAHARNPPGFIHPARGPIELCGGWSD